MKMYEDTDSLMQDSVASEIDPIYEQMRIHKENVIMNEENAMSLAKKLLKTGDRPISLR